MKKRLLTVALLGLGLAATAAPVDAAKAAKVARAFWAAHVDDKSAADLEPADWNMGLAYAFAAPQGGFVLVAADDVAHPILGYSPDARFSASVPVQLGERLGQYERAIARAVEAGMPTDPEWASLLGGLPTKDGDDAPVVEPLLQTHWDQEDPYNLLTPEYDFYGFMTLNAPTGCAATAQAQLMKYWNFPAFGNGSHTYSFDPEWEAEMGDYGVIDFGTLTADFAHTAYRWGAMQNTYSSSGGWGGWGGSTSHTDAEWAVAELMSHVGISLEMMYGEQASGAWGFAPDSLQPGDTNWACMNHSLRDRFFYDPQMQYLALDSVGDDAWMQLVVADLTAGRPILYGGGDEEEGGHAFVCDGIDSRQYLHFNWGWSGSMDGYFPLSAVAPGGGGIGGGSYNFTANQEALFRCQPLQACRMSDALLVMGNEAADTSVLYMTNAASDALVTLASGAQWLTITDTGGVRLALHLDANTTGADRESTVTLTQGTESVAVRVVQTSTPGNYVGIENVCDMPQVRVYPNPTTGIVRISRDGLTLHPQRLEIYGVDRPYPAPTSSTIDLRTMPAGQYIIRVVEEDGTVSLHRVIKK